MHNMCISCSKPSPCRAQRGTPQERARTPAPAWCGPRAGAGGASHEHIARARRGFGHVPRIDAVAAGSFRAKDPPAIRGTGYVVAALEAALWAFAKGRTFEEGALLAVNLGDDADTTGAKPFEVICSNKVVTSKDTLKATCAANGGQAIRLHPVNK